MKTITAFFILIAFLSSAVVVNTAAAVESKRTVDSAGFFNVVDFGAKGDGKALDTDAVNRAIDAAAAKGGGTVYLPAGRYLCFSIRLKSNITIFLDNGATVIAADPKTDHGSYDLPEPNEFDAYQDFGHTHWKNSLFWGIGVENVAIVGQGKIDGHGLTRRSPGPRKPRTAGETPASLGGGSKNAASPLGETSDVKEMDGQGNKAIALKLSRNVTLKDFTIFQGGHFALLATGVDNLTIDNLRIDTNRDGLDIDACRNVTISNTFVNSPYDDAIVLKSSYALGFNRATENVTITNSQVSAFDIGSFLDGTYKTTLEAAPDKDRPTGRVKLGTESNGGFKNIVISNVTFNHCRGLALETVDGGTIEDVSISNLTMRDVTTSPIFIRLGARQRAPQGTPIGAIHRVNISNVVASGISQKYSAIIAGLKGHDVEDVRLSNIRLQYKGGGTIADAQRAIPENENSYPEPSMFGITPSSAFYIRHARGITLDNVEVSYDAPDARPAFVLNDAKDIEFFRTNAGLSDAAKMFSLNNVLNFAVSQSRNLADTKLVRVEQKQF
ncbi:MAG TPA: glycoside hydrolase family 28 protein [Pyrinomonadaceae bacterium]